MAMKPVHILLVDDNPDDTLLIIRALGEKYARDVQAVGDGVGALASLRRQDIYAYAPRPDVVLLDLNLPKIDGRQVLVAIRSDPELKSVPVVILTSADTEDDSFKRYAGYANAYIRKSFHPEQFGKVLQGTLALLLSAPAECPNAPADLPAQTIN